MDTESQVAASSESKPEAEKKTTPTAPPSESANSESEKQNRGKPYDPAPALKKVGKAQLRRSKVNDAGVEADGKDLDTKVAVFHSTTARVTRGKAGLKTAQANAEAADRSAREAIDRIGGVIAINDAGRTFWGGCRSTTAALTLTNVEGQLPNSGYTVPAELLADANQKVAASTAANTALVAAMKEKVLACRAWMVAKKEVEQAVDVLNASVLRYRRSHGFKTRGPIPVTDDGANAPTSPPAASPTPPGTDPSGTQAVKP